MENLWPDFSDVKEIETPKKILLEQAANLENSTGGLLKASIINAPEYSKGNVIAYYFKIIAPFVWNYSVNIFRIEHPVLLYPLNLFFNLTDSGFAVLSEESLIDRLKEIFNHETTQRIIRSLLAQSLATKKENKSPFAIVNPS